MLTISLSLVFLAVLFLSGVPVAFSFALVVMIMAAILNYDLAFLLPYAFGQMRSILLLAIPLYIIAGAIMEKGNITRPLIDFVNTFASRVKGGMGAAAAVANGIFGAISGSAAAAVAAIGSIMIPQLADEEGYPRGYASSLLAASAGLSLLIPPSFSMILYGWITYTSITACFLAGALPGVLLMIFFIIINWFAVRRFPTVKRPRPIGSLRQFSKEVSSTGWRALPALLMPVLILGSIYGGIATPTEAAAIAAVYAIPVGFFVYRGLTAKNFGQALIESGMNIGAIMVMLLFAMVFSRMLVMEKVPQALSDVMLRISENRYVLLLVMNAFLFIVGMFVDDISGMIITAPLLFPIAKELGVTPVHFSAIIVTNLTMGNLTPPMAPLTFLAQLIGKTTFAEMLGPSLLFVFAGYVPVILVTTYWPPIAEWLPVAVLGPKVLIPAY